MDASVFVNLLFGVGTVVIASLVAIVVGRRRGLDEVDQRTDQEIKRLVDAQAARLLLLEAENARQAVAMADQRVTIATLTQAQADLKAKVEELEMALARERRITAGMRGEATG